MAEASKDTTKAKRKTRKAKSVTEVNIADVSNAIEELNELAVLPVNVTDSLEENEEPTIQTPHDDSQEEQILESLRAVKYMKEPSDTEKIPDGFTRSDKEEISIPNEVILKMLRRDSSRFVNHRGAQEKNNQRYTFGYTWNGQVMD